MKIRSCLCAGLLATAFGFALTSAPALASRGGDATAFLMNPARDGSVQLDGFSGPLKLKWSFDFQWPVSYPLIVKNAIYVTIGNRDGGSGTTLYAMSLKNGNILWAQPITGTYNYSYPTYDNGQIFVLNSDGQLSAFDSKKGTPGFSVHLGSEYLEMAPPVAYNGSVYADEMYKIYAIDEKTGAITWTQNGTGSYATIGDSQIFGVDEPYHYAYSLDGSPLWTKKAGSRKGNDTSYYHGRLYSPNGDVLDGATGKVVSKLDFYDYSAAFWTDADLNDFRIGISKGVLTSVDVQTGKVAWSFKGDASIISPPVVINDFVAVGTNGGPLYLLDAATGATVWSGNVAEGICAEDLAHGCAMAAGDGALVVPGQHGISVYVPAKKK